VKKREFQLFFKDKLEKRFYLVIFVLFLIPIVSFAYYFTQFSSNTKDFFYSTTTIIPTTTTTIVDSKIIELKENKAKLQIDINNITSKYSDTDISIAFKNSDFSQIQVYGKTTSYTGASTTKVITAVYYLSLVESGERTLDQYIEDHSAVWQIKQMINQSNNSSWHSLNNNIGYENLENYANSIGLASFDLSENTITAKDEALLLEKLYTGKLINNKHSDLLLSYMQNTNYETLIPAALPDGVTVYHKYGLLNNNLHDISIIKNDDKVFYLTILTDSKSTINYTERTKLFHEIVNAILEFEQI